MSGSQRVLAALAAIPGLVFVAISAVVVAAMACKVGFKYSFNVNEGWNAFWADVAWSGGDLYPPVTGLKLNNYPPLWFYLDAAVGHLVGDNIRGGRAIAAAALLLNGAVLSLIAREIVGPGRACWLAGTAFVALFGLFYQDYAAANDPQIAASLPMLIALWLVVRTTGPMSLRMSACVVGIMLLAGLVKHNIVAVPLSIALFLLIRRPGVFVGLAAFALVGAGMAAAGLYLGYGKPFFDLLLLPRPYSLDAAWEQSGPELLKFGVSFAVMPFLACRFDALLFPAQQPGPSPAQAAAREHARDNATLVLIFSVVSLVLGVALSGGLDVDVNVFFDLLFAVSIGLAVMGAVVARVVREHGRSSVWRGAATACWLVIALTPPLVAVPDSRAPIAAAFAAVADDAYAADLRYLRAASDGQVACEDLALCYWAGQPFNLDVNTLRIVAWAVPAVESEYVMRMETCRFSLIQLMRDWADPVDGPFTARVRDALAAHYEQVREGASGLYWRPRCAARQ